MFANLSRYSRVLAPWMVMVLGVPVAWAADNGAPLSSSFPGPLWDVVAPVGGTAAVADAHLTLTVPGGSNHDTMRPSNEAVRVVQSINDSNFDVSIKIDSAISAHNADTSQGLMVSADSQNFLTFDVDTNGTNISLAVHAVKSGVSTTVFNQAVFSEYHNPLCLRIARSGPKTGIKPERTTSCYRGGAISARRWLSACRSSDRAVAVCTPNRLAISSNDWSS